MKFKLNHYYRFTTKNADTSYDVISKVIDIDKLSIDNYLHLKDVLVIDCHYTQEGETEWSDYSETLLEAHDVLHIGSEFSRKTHPEYFL